MLHSNVSQHMFPGHHGVKTENEYLGTRRVMSVGYLGSKISTRFNPTTHYTVDALEHF